jgi:hypothetical protein
VKRIFQFFHALAQDAARRRRVEVLLRDLESYVGHYPSWFIEEVETEIRTLTNERIGARVNRERAA